MRSVILVPVLLFCILQLASSEDASASGEKEIATTTEESSRMSRGTFFGDDIPVSRPLSGNYLAPFIGFPHPSSRGKPRELDQDQDKDSAKESSSPSNSTAKPPTPKILKKQQKHYQPTSSTFTNSHTYYYTGSDRALLLDYPSHFEAHKSPVLNARPVAASKSQPQPAAHFNPLRRVQNEPPVFRVIQANRIAPENEGKDDSPKVHLDFVSEPKIILTHRQSQAGNNHNLNTHRLKEGPKKVQQFVRRMLTRLSNRFSSVKKNSNNHNNNANNRNGSQNPHQRQSNVNNVEQPGQAGQGKNQRVIIHSPIGYKHIVPY